MALSFDARVRLGAFEYEAAFEADDEILVLFGHSGAGKSVTLQLIAGLLRPDAGRIEHEGRLLYDGASGVHLRPQDRRVGYVVQELALFPHLSVLENVTFGMDCDRDERRRRGLALLERFGLEGFAGRAPQTLSGGQRQRVALARALAREAPLLLLDEPFSALDDALRRTLRSELLRLRRELGLTVLFVTHDLREAHLLADRLAVFDQGRILQIGAREEVFRRPDSRRVAELTGVANVLPGRVVALRPDGVDVEVEGLRLQSVSRAGELAVGGAVDVLIRAERVNLRRADLDEPGTNLLDAEVRDEHAYGAGHTLWFAPLGAGPALEVDLPSRPYEVLGVATRKRWVLELPPDDLHVVPAH